MREKVRKLEGELRGYEGFLGEFGFVFRNLGYNLQLGFCGKEEFLGRMTATSNLLLEKKEFES